MLRGWEGGKSWTWPLLAVSSKLAPAREMARNHTGNYAVSNRKISKPESSQVDRFPFQVRALSPLDFPYIPPIVLIRSVLYRVNRLCHLLRHPFHSEPFQNREIMSALRDMPNYAALIHKQNIHTVDSFTLESGVVLRQVPIAYKTWGILNERRDNVMVICHAFTGSADVEDWYDSSMSIQATDSVFYRWGPLMGIGKAFDPARYLIVCANVMGSPYGSASPVTINPETQEPYGPGFPSTTIRDDVRCVASCFRSYHGASRSFIGYTSWCWTISKYDPLPSSSAARWVE